MPGNRSKKSAKNRSKIHQARVKNATRRHKKALRKGARLIVVDPRRIDMARRADVHLQLLPGTNVAVLNGIMNVILQEGMADEEFIAECERRVRQQYEQATRG